MKTLKSIGKALFAVVLCLNFVSCNLQWVIVEEDTDDNYITVGLNCGGEFLDISNSPLSKAAGDDLFYIQVYSLKEYPQEGKESYYEEIPYAYGVFESSLDDVTIKLLDGAAYRFKIAIVVGGSYGGDPAMGMYNKEFNYDRNYYSDPSHNIQRTREGFYGELDKYVPVEGESVTIDTKRVSYGAEFIAENLTEGIMRISVYSNYGGSIYTVELTPENPTSDKIYSFSNVWSAWYGMTMPTGNYDPETGNMIYEQVDYYNEKTLTVNWVKSEDNVVPLGNYKVTFQRNVKTTIRIKAEEIASSKGMSVTREDTEITLDDTEYVIEGGKVIEVPIN